MTSAPQSQAKHWAGCTMPNYTEEIFNSIPSVLDALCSYYVFGKEIAPKTGLPHLQFMCSFKGKKRLSVVRKLFPIFAHWEVKSKYSTFLQASDYCKKEGDFIEFGVLPIDPQRAASKASSEKWSEAKESALNGDLDDIEPEIFIKHYQNLKRIRSDKRNKKVPKDLDWQDNSPPNEWIWGPTGTGKPILCIHPLKF